MRGRAHLGLEMLSHSLASSMNLATKYPGTPARVCASLKAAINLHAQQERPGKPESSQSLPIPKSNSKELFTLGWVVK